MEVLANGIVSLWSQWVFPLLQFIIGLGVVVFVHEFGHFLAAKWVGIKVETFALGFGPRLFGWKRGDTDYCVKVLPLGGYIKMLGQEDFAPLKEDEKPDPRAYGSKSVGARMLVISAGVIMNVILAAILFVIVGLVGMNFGAPVIGDVRPSYPAATVELSWQPYAAATGQPASAPASAPAFGPGLKPGDRIVELDGQPVARFSALDKASILARNAEETFEIAVARTDDSGREWLGRGRMAVEKDPLGQRFVFGIGQAVDTVFDKQRDLITARPFKENDRLTAIDGSPIEHNWQLEPLAQKLYAHPVKASVSRDGETVTAEVLPRLYTAEDVVWLKDGRRGQVIGAHVDKSGKGVYEAETQDGGRKEFKKDELAGGLPFEVLDIVGMLPRLQVNSVAEGSPAETAGLRPDDVVLAYGDHETPIHEQFVEISDKLVGQNAQVVVLRDGKQETLTVRPKKRKEGAQVGLGMLPDQAHTALAGIREGSPAQRAGLAAGDTIQKINGTPVATWNEMLAALRAAIGQDVTVTFLRGGQEQTASLGKIDESVLKASDHEAAFFDRSDFKLLLVTIRQTNPLQAIAWGAGETGDLIMVTYGSLRALATRTVSTDTLSGPVGIGGMAVTLGRDRPLIDFVYFMAFISATIAVINFLPLPVVDGGHAVFLIIEKITGKPLPVSVMNVVQFIGLALLGLVFILLTWQDIARFLERLW